MTILLSHSDDVSGTTILSDGSKLHWTEGRSSNVIVVTPSGAKYEIDPAYEEACGTFINDEYVPPPNQLNEQAKEWMRQEREIEENGADEYRTMTPEEEQEWDDARNA